MTLRALNARFKVACFLIATVFSASTHAYNFKATELEYAASTDTCKRALVGGGEVRVVNPIVAQPYQNTTNKDLFNLIWKVGGWHYCGGAIKLMRAQLVFEPKQKQKLLNQVISNTNYSFSRIDKSHPWAVDMAVTLAQAYKELGNISDAYKILGDILRIHPGSEKVLTTYGLFHYQEGNYQHAREHLTKAKDASAGRSPQIEYFLGLTAYRLGEIDTAEDHAAAARDLGYPLKGLQRMIDGSKAK